MADDLTAPPLPSLIPGDAPPAVGDVPQLELDSTGRAAWRRGPVVAGDIADGSITQAKLAANAVTAAKASTGTGATNLAAGNDTRFSQVPTRTASGAITVASTDIGGVINCTGAGAQAAALPSLASSVVAGFAMTVTFVQEGAATLVTITPAGGTINGAATLALTAGYGTRTIVSIDGLNWIG